MRQEVAKKNPSELKDLSIRCKHPVKPGELVRLYIRILSENDKEYSLITEIQYKREIPISENTYKDKYSYIKSKYSFEKNNLYLTKIKQKDKKYYILLNDNTPERKENNNIIYNGYRVRMQLDLLQIDDSSEDSS